MKPAKIFYQYVWIISTLRTYRQLTLEQLSQKWQQNGIIFHLTCDIQAANER